MLKKKQTEYYGGRIKGIIEHVAKMVKNDPTLAEDFTRLHSILGIQADGYGKKENCFNCKRSMKITVYEADLLDALLVLSMAKAIRHEMTKGISFTEANKVHLPTLNASNATIKRNTKCDYLGLVKQPSHWRGTGYWLLTGLAWKALRGEEIPAKVKYWEGELIERSDAKTTLTAMFNKHRDLVEASIAKRNAIKVDHRCKFDGYTPSEWTEFGGYIQAQIPTS